MAAPALRVRVGGILMVDFSTSLMTLCAPLTVPGKLIAVELPLPLDCVADRKEPTSLIKLTRIAPPNLSQKKSTKSKGSFRGHQKAASSLGGLGGFFKSHSNSKSASNLASSSTPAFFKPSNGSKSTNNLASTPGDLESGKDIELKERQRSS